MPSHGHRSGRRSRSQKRPAIIGRDIPVLPKKQSRHVYTDEEVEFIRSKLEAGLTGPEVCRMFFRHYTIVTCPPALHTTIVASWNESSMESDEGIIIDMALAVL